MRRWQIIFCKGRTGFVRGVDSVRVAEGGIPGPKSWSWGHPFSFMVTQAARLHGAHVRIDVDRKTNQLKFETMSKEAMA